MSAFHELNNETPRTPKAPRGRSKNSPIRTGHFPLRLAMPFLCLFLASLTHVSASEATGLSASYYQNESLVGPPTLERIDPQVAFSWGAGGPGAPIGSDGFSVRWRGTLTTPTTESLTLILRTDDGVRLWVDGVQVINSWIARSEADSTYSLPAQANRSYAIQIEYFERTGGATAQFLWQSASLTRQLVPTTALKPFQGLAASYYANEHLNGPVALSRIDKNVDFQWGSGGPGTPVGNDSFSARWVGSVTAPATESLSLVLRSDDGIRLWVDGALVINDWIARSSTDSIYTFAATAGRKYALRIEYFERTGGAVAQLLWQSASIPRQVIPAAALTPAAPFTLPLVASSVVNPAFLEGTRTAGTLITATAGSPSTNVPVPSLGDVAFYLDVPLSASATTEALVSSGTYQTKQLITWTPTLVAGEKLQILRLNDSLLFTFPAAGTMTIVHECGVQVPSTPVTTATKYAYKFARSGTFQVYARNTAGVEVGHCEVIVVDVDLDGPIANQVNYRREKGIGLKGGLPTDVTFVSSDLGLLEVSVKEPTSYGTRLYLKATRRGTPNFSARIGGPTGPIAKSIDIDEFVIESGLTYSLPTSTAGVGKSNLVMRPLVRNMTAMLDLFAHSTTFPGGVKKMDVPTSTFIPTIDPVASEEIGTLNLTFEVPQNETDYCFRSTFDQVSKYGTTTGSITYNGSIVRIYLLPDPDRLPYNKSGFEFTANAIATKPTKFGPFDIKLENDPSFDQGKAIFTSGDGNWEGITDNSRPIVLNTLKANGAKQSEGGETVWLCVKKGDTTIAMVDFAICAHPVNFRKGLSGGVGTTLIQDYKWDSDSGDLADLDLVNLYEYVTYSAQPNPPFTQPAPSPTIHGADGITGKSTDRHFSLGAIKGTVGVAVAEQNIYFDCDRELTSKNLLYGPVAITRRVEPLNGVWRYSLVADGVPFGFNLP